MNKNFINEKEIELAERYLSILKRIADVQWNIKYNARDVEIEYLNDSLNDIDEPVQNAYSEDEYIDEEE